MNSVRPLFMLSYFGEMSIRRFFVMRKWMLISLVCVVLFSALAVADVVIRLESGGKSSLHNWMCQKCSAIVQSKDRPSASNCPSKQLHQWNNLGAVGDTTYQCKKCSAQVQSKDKPSANGCPSGGLHQWNRLTR